MKYEEVRVGEKEGPTFVPILIAAIVFPFSVFLWALSYTAGILTPSGHGEDDLDSESPSPSRWFLSVFLAITFTFYGVRRKSLSGSGALMALVVGFFLTLSNYCFMVSLLAFFLSSSKATKYRANQKKTFEEDFKEGGQRNWIQVLCNGGMATELAIMYLTDVGYGERPISFSTDYRASWLGIGVLGAIACANGDTWASELGTVVSIFSSKPRLITTWREVPRGTNGGVTIGGLLFSLFGGLFIGLAYYLTLIFFVDSSILERSLTQWPIIVLGGAGGLFGSIIDSLLGAIFQYSGVDKKGRIREVPGPDIKHISGVCFLDNHSVNLLSTVLTGLLLPQIARNFMWY